MPVFMLHELPIYEEQMSCANNIMKEFNKNNVPILLIAEMQQGKTGTVICMISKFKQKCEEQNKTYQIIYIINLRDNDIREQTEIRLCKAGLQDEVTVLHHANINKIQPLAVDARLIIIDECHVALGKEKPFHNFMSRFGINYGSSIDTWSDRKNFVVSVSATPYSHVIKTKFDLSSFKPIVLEMSSNYYSLQHMQEADRIRQAECMVDVDGIVTLYFNKRVREFLAICTLSGPGYLIVRTQGTKLQSIVEHLNGLNISLSVRKFNCQKGNIHMLDVTLSTKPVKPTVVIISGSLRAGKTLTTTKHIKMWLDSHRAKADTICQSIGRCLGYPSNNHSKFDDEFMVFCNTRELDACIEFFNKYECSPNIPAGNWNKTYKAQPIDGGYVALPFTTEEEVRSVLQDVANISICSKNNEHNIALTVLNDLNRGHSLEDKKFRIYYIDGPNSNYMPDFELLKKKKPHLIGKFVKYTINNNKESTSNTARDYLPANGMFLVET